MTTVFAILGGLWLLEIVRRAIKTISRTAQLEVEMEQRLGRPITDEERKQMVDFLWKDGS